MRYNEHKSLCLTFDELVPAIMGKPNYDQLKARKQIVVIGRAAYGKEVLIEFETMPGKYKDEVKKKYGNPYDYVAKQPLVDWVKINWDWEAEKFYNAYVLSPSQPSPEGRALNRRLPEAAVEKYTKAATWLKAIEHFTTDKRALKQALNVSLDAFWTLTCELIKANDVSLPQNERRLRD